MYNYRCTIIGVLSCLSLNKCIIFFYSEPPEFDMKNYPKNTVYVRAGSNLKFELPLTGKPMPKVTMARNKIAAKTGKRFSYEVTPESLLINLKESIANDAGRYDITASNSSGTTKMFVNILVLDRPSQPVGPVEVGEVTETTVCLKWLPPVYEGSSPVTNYVVLRRETSTSAWTEVSSQVARSAVKVTKLTKGEEYQFRIKAENRFGISDHIDSRPVMVKLPYSKYFSVTWIPLVLSVCNHINTHTFLFQLSLVHHQHHGPAMSQERPSLCAGMSQLQMVETLSLDTMSK